MMNKLTLVYASFAGKHFSLYLYLFSCSQICVLHARMKGSQALCVGSLFVIGWLQLKRQGGSSGKLVNLRFPSVRRKTSEWAIRKRIIYLKKSESGLNRITQTPIWSKWGSGVLERIKIHKWEERCCTVVLVKLASWPWKHFNNTFNFCLSRFL